MMKFVLMLCISILCCACGYNNIGVYKEHLQTHASNANQLSGTYTSASALIRNFPNIARQTKNETFDETFELIPKNEHRLLLRLFKNNVPAVTYTLHGQYKSGYFRVKRLESSSEFGGIVLWTVGKRARYIGLTENRDLCVVSARGLAALVFVALPIYYGGSVEISNTFNRI